MFGILLEFLATWLEGTILDQIGPVSFQIRLADGRIRKRHVDHIRIRYPEEIALPSQPVVVEGQMFHLQMEIHNSLGTRLVEMVPALRDMFLCHHPADH